MNKKTLSVCKPLTLLCLTLIFTSFAVSQSKESDYKLAAVTFVNGYGVEAGQTNDLRRQFYLLSYLAPAAVVAGEPEKAENYANELRPLLIR